MVLGRDPGARQGASDRSASGPGKQGVASTPEGTVYSAAEGLPIRIFIFTPFIALVLVMVGVTAIVALRAQRRCGPAGDEAPPGSVGAHSYPAGRLPVTFAVADRRPARPLPRLFCCEASPPARTAVPSSSTGPARSIASSALDGDPVVESAVAGLARHTSPAGSPRSDGVPVRSFDGEAAVAGNVADIRDVRIQRRHHGPSLDSGHGDARSLLSSRRARGWQPFGHGLRRGAGAVPRAGRGAGVNGDRPAPAHRARHAGHGRGDSERTGARQQARGTGSPGAVVQRLGGRLRSTTSFFFFFFFFFFFRTTHLEALVASRTSS